MVKPDFWDNSPKAQKVIEELNSHKKWVDSWKKWEGKCEDLSLLIPMAGEEDKDILKELEEEIQKGIESLEFQFAMREEDDEKSAILTIHPGAGGTESQDWASILLRMYLRWIEQKGFEGKIIDFQPGEEAGIKDAVVEVVGRYAYGYLKAESGIHRLVRLSPFDANHRRHTSFVSVFVYPEVPETIQVEIKDSEIKMDTFRSSSAGGQNVNKLNTAVRLTHLPTGIVVTCQTERSQYQNRENAMKILRAKLYQRYREEEKKRQAKLEETKTLISWGNQIRSYVFHPYNLVKDHRTGVETSQVQAVLDGDLDLFIQAYLLMVSSPSK